MNARLILPLIGGTLVVAAVACGGDSSSPAPTPEVRSQSGARVAAAVKAGERFQQQLSEGGGQSDGSAAPASARGGDSASYPAAAYAISNDGITVAGYGMAVADADSATLELYFSTTSVYPRSDSGGGSSGAEPGASSAQPTSGLTEADLQPVIEAITGAGVERADIQYIGGSYYDPYYASATLRVTVRDIENTGEVVNAATGAAAGLTDVYLQNSYVSYTLLDCTSLEVSALEAAIADAEARSAALARALGVTRGSIQGASSDAYWPYGGVACGGGYLGPYPVGGIAYAEGQSQQVTMYSTVSVTYAIQ
jgi:uncharacterized protein YggE